MTTEPTQPPTDEELDEVRFRVLADYVDPGSEALLMEARRDRCLLLDEVDRLRAENTAQAAEAKQAWSEGHATALAAGCDSEDQFRTNLGVLLVAEEHRCQLAINDAPTDPHLNGRLVGLQRARDIVTGDAFRAPDLSGEGQAHE